MGDLQSRLFAYGKIETMDLPDIGKVFLRRMDGGERDTFLAATALDQDKATPGALQRLLLRLTLCDESGSRIFANQEELKKLDSGLTDKLALEASRINGFSKEAKEEIEKKVEAEKSTSGTSSPPDSGAQ